MPYILTEKFVDLTFDRYLKFETTVIYYVMKRNLNEALLLMEDLPESKPIYHL